MEITELNIGGSSPFASIGLNRTDVFDPSENIKFVNPPSFGIDRYDRRKDFVLRESIFDHESPLERERAIWEYADRHTTNSLDILSEVLAKEPNPAIRNTTLWAIQKYCQNRGLDSIYEALSDEHEEVRSWANLLIWEITGQTVLNDQRPKSFNEENPFDQTLPLQIAGYARTLVPGVGWIQATLSPMWFESIMGRVMACTNQETFDDKLIIEKKVDDFYDDGLDYFEIYEFSGHTIRVNENIKYHTYSGQSKHNFFPSGKVGLVNQEPPCKDMTVAVKRSAATYSEPFEEDPSKKIVKSVRGIYSGDAYINTEYLMSNHMKLGKGEVQLTDIFHPVGSKYTNTYLFGTFKGKLSDLNDSGRLDVNTEPCHGTKNGELDYHLIGKKSNDPHDIF
ncbi:HEAT repeat domain-containing protein [Flagellimonas sp.]|uniref:HEAT repeat domain-containing protein n=1 Tax=Flagellimonas sp. TaxID=2058762 RepID=UPI003F4A0EB4